MIPGWALAVDILGGEPPATLHPTVWMGRMVGRALTRHRAGSRDPITSLVAGAVLVGAGIAVSATVAAACERTLRLLTRSAPRPARDALAGAPLKPALSLRALVEAGGKVEDALRSSTLSEARRLLAWHLVSRDTSRLSESEVAGAAIESMAENLSDGFVGPVMAYAAGGLPAAYAYRFINTADAMLGYRTPELEWFGKPAARMDDAINLIPSRVAALLITLVASPAGGSTRGALAVARADGGRTPSPNAGWPMAAMAGALGVRLDKYMDDDFPRANVPRLARRPLYILNRTGRQPTVQDIGRARRIVAMAAVLMTATMATAAMASAVPPEHP